MNLEPEKNWIKCYSKTHQEDASLLCSVLPIVDGRKIDWDLEHCNVSHAPAMLPDLAHTKNQIEGNCFNQILFQFKILLQIRSVSFSSIYKGKV